MANIKILLLTSAQFAIALVQLVMEVIAQIVFHAPSLSTIKPLLLLVYQLAIQTSTMLILQLLSAQVVTHHALLVLDLLQQSVYLVLPSI